MAGNASEDNALGRPSEGLLSSQRSQSGDSLVEWRSSEQVENGIPSTSPLYWGTDDEDGGEPKPSELYGKFTWKIENFSQISKRELRSNAFEVGGYKWYILIYPQGCDVCNHLSLFLCVANHDKHLPGWSHFAQFTIAVVNKDPKKSKYSDTLHRFWKKEHDWGWKKFMELSKVFDGFIVSDTLTIKAQVQVIREKADRPFRCLDSQYRRELVRVYLSNVELICRRFVEERRGKLGKLIEDKVRWSSFRAFWLGLDQNARRRMSRDKTDAILKVVVKHFFMEKEVASTLVLDSLYSGFKVLESQSTNKNKLGKGGRSGEVEDTLAPIIEVEKDMLVLAGDILMLLERAAMEPLPPKDDKGPQNRIKDGPPGEDFNKEAIVRDERRLTELGRRTIEIFVLAHIFSNRIEVAYQEAVALKRQEELIREEEAAEQAENEFKAKRGAFEKEKRSKKKQVKQRRSSRKGTDKGKDEKLGMTGKDKNVQVHPGESTLEVHPSIEKPDTPEDVSDVSDAEENFTGTLQPGWENRDACRVNWDTDTLEANPIMEASRSGMSSLPVQDGGGERRSVMDDTSSTCSTDSVPSVVINGPYKLDKSMADSKTQTSPSRGKYQHNKSSHDHANCSHDTNNQTLDPTASAIGISKREDAPDSVDVLSLKDQIQQLEQTLVERQEEFVSLQRQLSVKDQVEVETPTKPRTTEALSSHVTTSRIMPSHSPPQAGEPIKVREEPSNRSSQTQRVCTTMASTTQTPSISKGDNQKSAIPAKSTCTSDRSRSRQVLTMPQPLSAPSTTPPQPDAHVTGVQNTPLIARSVSAAGRLGTDPAHSYVPQSYRNAIMGRTVNSSSAGAAPHRILNSPNPPATYSQPPPTKFMVLSPQESGKDEISSRSSFRFGTVTPEISHGPQGMEVRGMEVLQQEMTGMLDPHLLNDISSHGVYGSSSVRPNMYFSEELHARQAQAQAQAQAQDDFPHLDIINYLLDEEQSTEKIASEVLQNPNNCQRRSLNRQLTFPFEVGVASMGPLTNSCKVGRISWYEEDEALGVCNYSNAMQNAPRNIGLPVGLPGYANRQIDGFFQNQWPLNGAADLSMINTTNMEGVGNPFQLPDYSNLACGLNGYTMFRPANGH